MTPKNKSLYKSRNSTITHTNRMSATVEKPGLAACSHVQGHIINEPSLKASLGAADVAITRRDGTVVNFHRLSYAVAELILAEGVKPLVTNKQQVIEYAHRVVDATASQSEPESEPEPAPAAKAPTVKATAAVAVANPPASVGTQRTSPAGASTDDRVALGRPLAVYVLLGSAVEVAAKDTSPGSEDRRAQLVKLADAYRAAIP